MRLLITCEFDECIQVLIIDPATEHDAQILDQARREDPGDILMINCRVTADGPSRNRLVRAGRIINIEPAAS